MISSYWNSLRVGDEVLVHDDDTDFAISPGTVAFVETRPGSNGVTARTTVVDGAVGLVRPERLAVHLRTGDSPGECWRCDASASGASKASAGSMSATG